VLGSERGGLIIFLQKRKTETVDTVIVCNTAIVEGGTHDAGSANHSIS
jgi:hypothetical protein